MDYRNETQFGIDDVDEQKACFTKRGLILKELTSSKPLKHLINQNLNQYEVFKSPTTGEVRFIAPFNQDSLIMLSY